MDYEDDFFRSNPQQDDAPRPSLLDELRNSSDEEEAITGGEANFGHPHHQHHHHRRKGDDAEPFENDDDEDEEDATSSDESDGYGDMGGVIQHQRVTSSHAAQFLYAQATAAARAAAASSSSSGGSGGAATSLAAALMMQQRSRPPQDDDDEDSDEEEDEEYEEEDEEDNDAAAPSRAGPSHADLLAMLSQRLQQQQQQQQPAAAAARGVLNEGSGASTHPAQDSSAAATVASDPRQIQSSLEADLAALLKQDDDLAQVAKEIHAAARANELNRSQQQQQQQQQQAPSRMQVGGPGGPPMGPPGMGRMRPPRSGAGGMYQPASFFAPNGGMPLPRGVGGGRYGGGGGPPSHHLHHHHHHQHHSGVPPPAGWYDYEAAAGAAGGYPFPAEFLLAHGYATAEGGAAVPFGGEYPPGMLAAVGFGMPPHRMRSQAAGQPIRTNRGGEPPMAAVPPPLGGQGLPPMQSVFLPDPLTTPPPKPLRTTIRLQDLHRHLHLNERMLEDLQRLWRDCAESGNTKLMEAGLGTVLDLQRHVVELAKTSVREETEREMRDEVQKRMKELAKLAAAQAAAGSLDPNSAATPEKGGDATAAAAAAANSTTAAAAAAAGSFVPNVNAMPFTPPPSLSLTHTDMEPSLRPPPPAISYLAMLGGGSGHNNNNNNNNNNNSNNNNNRGGGGGSSHNHHASQSSPLTPQQQQQLQHLHGGSTSGSASRGHHQPSFQEVAAKHSTSIPNFHDAPSLPGASSAPSTSSSVAGGQQSHSANSYLAKLASKPSQNKNSPPQKGSGESHYPHYEGGDGGSDGGGGVSPHSMKPATSTSHQTSSSSSSVPPFLLANLPTLDTSYPHSHQQQQPNTSNTSPSHEESAAAGQSAALTYLALARSAASKSGPTLKKALTLSASESGGGISLAALEATIAQQKEAAHLMSIPVGRTKKDSAPQPPAAAPDIDPTTTPVAYVEFKRSRIGKFPSTKVIEPGNYVIVTGDRGLDCGLLVQMTAPTKGGVSVMTMEGSVIDEEQIKVEPNTEIIRLADDHEVEVMHETIPELERVALRSCRESCKALRLGIDVLDCEFQFDRKKVSFYYYSEDVIDFRDLVKVMYKTYGARIWMENVNLEVRNMSPPKERRKERKAARAAAAAARAVLLGRR